MWLPDVVDPLDSMFPPELSIPSDSIPHPGVASRRTSLPFAFPPPVPLPSALDDQSEAGHHQDALSIGLSVQCEDTKMVVSINKESLQVSGEPIFIQHGGLKINLIKN